MPNAVDDEYTVNQNEVLDASTVLVNDNNKIVNNPKRNLQLKTEIKKNVNNGKIKFNEDGTFQYIPDKGFSGKDTFEYNVVLVIDGKEYIKSAKVTINVIPKQPETPSETASEKETPTPTETVSEKETPTPTETASEKETPTPSETASEKETPTPTETVSEKEIPSESGTPTQTETPAVSQNDEITSQNIRTPEVAANEEEVIAKTSVKTGDRSNMMYFIMLMLSVGTAMTTTVVVYKKKKEE